jgi:hypothetical protein
MFIVMPTRKNAQWQLLKLGQLDRKREMQMITSMLPITQNWCSTIRGQASMDASGQTRQLSAAQLLQQVAHITIGNFRQTPTSPWATKALPLQVRMYMAMAGAALKPSIDRFYNSPNAVEHDDISPEIM